MDLKTFTMLLPIFLRPSSKSHLPLRLSTLSINSLIDIPVLSDKSLSVLIAVICSLV